MTPEDFDALFDAFQHTAYRLETLPAYDVGDIGNEADRFRAFREGTPISERSVRTDPWLARIALSTLTGGKTWKRVRVVDDPMTDFERYELTHSLPEAQAAGDENFIVPRSVVGSVPDCWIFDLGEPDAHAVLMRYGASNYEWLGCELVTEPERLQLIQGAWRRALRLAAPLNEFVALGYRDRRVAGHG